MKHNGKGAKNVANMCVTMTKKLLHDLLRLSHLSMLVLNFLCVFCSARNLKFVESIINIFFFLQYLDTKVLEWLRLIYIHSEEKVQCIDSFRERLKHFIYETYAEVIYNISLFFTFFLLSLSLTVSLPLHKFCDGVL